QAEPRQLMREIKVDPYGIKIMVPKGIVRLVRVDSLSNIAANILKQEMLSLGGDVAVARGALTGQTKKTDCLVIGSLSQLAGLKKKLYRQPFGLGRLADRIDRSLSNYHKNNYSIDLGSRRLVVGKRPLIMGVINLTPDSFSGDGFYRQGRSRAAQLSAIIEYAQKIIGEGADIIDIGGESSRLQASAIPQGLEAKRVIPVIKAMAKKIKAPISIDTYKPQTARLALENGALIINDISGLRNRRMIETAARHKCAVVAMHMRGTPRTMQKDPRYECLIKEIMQFLDAAIRRAADAGISRERIIVDPGIGFGKTVEDNLRILKSLKEFKVLGCPVLVGPSRKSFIGKITAQPVEQRLCGTIASCVLAAQNGAKIIRVHDVKQAKEALKIWEAISYA
ncbi:MAG: dihydropteroate synthase, partial [Candidatus Omnitrophota bacterium]